MSGMEKESKKVETCMCITHSLCCTAQTHTLFYKLTKSSFGFPLHCSPNFSQELVFISVALPTADPTSKPKNQRSPTD